MVTMDSCWDPNEQRLAGGSTAIIDNHDITHYSHIFCSEAGNCFHTWSRRKLASTKFERLEPLPDNVYVSEIQESKELLHMSHLHIINPYKEDDLEEVPFRSSLPIGFSCKKRPTLI
ncbi:hypothetical protein TorRG33x02_161930 [Trema orientale]|uniref:Uncharacterized protein n=1 Tax=Trema orientale TaxID=63057 RepID=A0A2P5ER21_TREOI|nr:hypothetical protein TorRG33x02_161930 [Trema orientale]